MILRSNSRQVKNTPKYHLFVNRHTPRKQKQHQRRTPSQSPDSSGSWSLTSGSPESYPRSPDSSAPWPLSPGSPGPYPRPPGFSGPYPLTPSCPFCGSFVLSLAFGPWALAPLPPRALVTLQFPSASLYLRRLPCCRLQPRQVPIKPSGLSAAGHHPSSLPR